MAHVTSVHYAISIPFIYTIIFNFFPAGRGLCFESSLIHLIYAIRFFLIFSPMVGEFVFLFSAFALGVFLNFGARLFFWHFVVGGH